MEQHYPDSAGHFRELPPHAVEHLGSIALGVTHEFMHPIIEEDDRSGDKKVDTE